MPRARTTGAVAHALGVHSRTLINNLHILKAAGIVEEAGGSPVTGFVWRLHQGADSNGPLTGQLLDAMAPCVDAALAMTTSRDPWQGLARFFQALHSPTARQMVWTLLGADGNLSVEQLRQKVGSHKLTVLRHLTDLANAGVWPGRPACSNVVPSPPARLAELMRDISRLDEQIKPHRHVISSRAARIAPLGIVTPGRDREAFVP